jgi:dynein heavy chain
LGKNLGRYVFVYNCSEGIDVKKMRDLFEGLIMTGFWGCFDEFNRIEIEVLSVLAI